MIARLRAARAVHEVAIFAGVASLLALFVWAATAKAVWFG